MYFDHLRSWACYSGICEALRVGSVTSPLPVSASASASSTISPPPVPPPPSNTSVPSTQSGPNGAGSPSAKVENDKGSPTTTSIIVGAVLGVISLCLALVVVLLIWRRQRKTSKIHPADDPRTQQFPEVPPLLGTLRPVPFLATQTSGSSPLSPKTPRSVSAAQSASTSQASWARPTSPTAREELREAVREAVREAIPPQSRGGDSWHTMHVDALPPSYSRGDAAG
ncbi:hypothetical protein B0H19DRAFT_1105763 [Mycena capillaripes]|nr:hypothetical protein B0H19DRAFT_1105763 [Mycena capillaripes]